MLLAGRGVDAVTDPLMGTLSDRTRSRFGRRRPYIVTGSILIAIALIFLFNPPAASAASLGGVSVRPNNRTTMKATCCFSAVPWPTMADLTWAGV